MIKRTFDKSLIHEILSDPILNERVTMDGNVEMFDPENQRDLYYLLACDGDDILGFLLFHVFNSPICFQIHANYMSKYWGEGLPAHTKEAVKWMFNNTDAKKILALCPTKFPEVEKHALKAGFTNEGLLTKSSIYDGEICDNHIMGISKC